MVDLRSKYGEWAIVTGASEGIGKSFATELAKRSVNLVLVARRADLLTEFATMLQHDYSVETLTVKADLACANGQQLVLETTKNLDVGLYIAAAGFGTSGTLIEGNIESELNMLTVNCSAVLRHCYEYGRRFKARSKGAIVLFSSIVGFQGVPNTVNYAATKAYIQSLSEGLNKELNGHGIDVLAVAPGPVQTGFAEQANMQMSQADQPDVVARQSLKSLGKRTTVRPGFWGKLLGYSLSITPRWGRILIMSRVMSSMTKHQLQKGA